MPKPTRKGQPSDSREQQEERELRRLCEALRAMPGISDVDLWPFWRRGDAPAVTFAADSLAAAANVADLMRPRQSGLHGWRVKAHSPRTRGADAVFRLEGRPFAPAGDIGKLAALYKEWAARGCP